MQGRFPDVPCPRCQVPGQLNTAPLRLIPPGVANWPSLCDACFRSELGAEPSDDLKMRPIHHNRRGRR